MLLVMIGLLTSCAYRAPGAENTAKIGAATTTPQAHDALTTDALDAYEYGYPLVLMRALRQQSTNVTAPDSTRGMAPLNQFAYQDTLPGPESHTIVLPSKDTLYATAWLDLHVEPMVLHVPDTHGRYYQTPILDSWTDVIASPGSRTTGTGAGDFLITSPHWKGHVPQGVQQLPSPTDTAWIVNRVEYRGRDDLKAARAVADGFTLTPLSSYGKPYTPPRNKTDPNVPPGSAYTRVATMSAQDFFSNLASALVDDPPTPQDKPMVATLARLGIVPGKPFRLDAAGPAAAQALTSAAAGGPAAIKSTVMGQQRAHDWLFDMATGRYGTDYPYRARIAMLATGASIPKDSVYYWSTTDNSGATLDGANSYVIHFAPGTLPPVHGFWSITLYSPDGYLMPDPIDRYSIGHVPPAKPNADGSVDVYVQHGLPAHETNWLPAPSGQFQLVLRLYWPADSVLNDTWAPPGIQRQD